MIALIKLKCLKIFFSALLKFESSRRSSSETQPIRNFQSRDELIRNFQKRLGCAKHLSPWTFYLLNFPELHLLAVNTAARRKLWNKVIACNFTLFSFFSCARRWAQFLQLKNFSIESEKYVIGLVGQTPEGWKCYTIFSCSSRGKRRKWHLSERMTARI